MRIRVGRIFLAAFLVEALAILVLVLIVAVAGPREPEAAQEYAGRLGIWVGPLAGFALSILGGWWVARGLASTHVLHGLLLGAAVAAIDIALLVAGGAAFALLFAVSNLGRILAGGIGGWLAGRSVTSRV